MNCPICGKDMQSAVCACGYDESRNYEKYPSFSPVPPDTVSVSRLALQHNALIRCGGCGHSGFALNHLEGAFRCLQCGRALTQEELVPMIRSLGLLSVTFGKPAAQSEPQSPESTEITAVAAGGYHTVALYTDGTCRAIGDDFYGQCRVDTWQNVRLIAANETSTVGLTHDGSLLFAGKAEQDPKLLDFRKRCKHANLSEVEEMALGSELVLRCKNGTVKASVKDLKWTRVDTVTAGKTHLAALHRDGSISVEPGDSPMVKNHIRNWARMKKIASGYWHISALKWDGTVHSTDFLGDTSGWTKIASITAGADYTAGLHEDGTVVISGSNAHDVHDCESWTDIAQIYAGAYHIVGRRKDGTLVAAGLNSSGQCDVHKLVKT